MKLSVIIPVYNEKENIKEILKRVRATDIEKEIIVVDDYSTDDTRKILETENHGETKVIYHSKNEGKGAAIRTALPHVTGDIVIIQDADLEYDPNDYYKLIEPIQKKEYKVVYGSRFLDKRNKHKYGLNLFGTKFLTLLSNILYNAKITDEATCYKVFDGEVLKSINFKCKRFEFCPEVTAKIRKMGYKIKELPICYYPRSFEEGKKISWKDGVEAVWTLIKYKFGD